MNVWGTSQGYHIYDDDVGDVVDEGAGVMCRGIGVVHRDVPSDQRSDYFRVGGLVMLWTQTLHGEDEERNLNLHDYSDCALGWHWPNREFETKH